MDLLRAKQPIKSYARFDDLSEQASNQRVRIVAAPNRVQHSFYIPPSNSPITTTPHEELLGHDVTRFMVDPEDYAPMDEKTSQLYLALQALRKTFDQDLKFSSTSIFPYSVDMNGPINHRTERLRGKWNKSMDRQVVDTIADHMGWSAARIKIESRQMTQSESENLMMRDILSVAVKSRRKS